MNTRNVVTRFASMAAILGGVAFGTAAVAGDYGSTSAADAKASMMDTNKDGRISADEHAAGAQAMFGKIDTNGDGKVTAAEMDAYHATKKEAGAAKETGASKYRMSSAEKIRKIDTDGDGTLTAEEHAAGSRAMFTSMDTDKDGSVSTAELKAGHDKRMSEAASTAKQDQ